MSTKIEWTDETINPIVGCSKISEGCKNCYAEKMAYRLKCMGIPKYQDVVDKNGWTGKIGVDMNVFDKIPKSPKKIFINSMGDLFHGNVQEADICNVWTSMGEFYNSNGEIQSVSDRPGHTYMVLTKRPERALDILNRRWPGQFARRNVWIGVTVESPDYLCRIDDLLKIPAAVRFVSVEPMLKAVDLEEYLSPLGSECCSWGEDHRKKTCGCRHNSLDWVIAGPETGPGKRECKPEWILDLYEQCQAAGVPFFDKRKKNWLAREFPKQPSI